MCRFCSGSIQAGKLRAPLVAVGRGRTAHPPCCAVCFNHHLPSFGLAAMSREGADTTGMAWWCQPRLLSAPVLSKLQANIESRALPLIADVKESSPRRQSSSRWGSAIVGIHRVRFFFFLKREIDPLGQVIAAAGASRSSEGACPRARALPASGIGR